MLTWFGAAWEALRRAGRWLWQRPAVIVTFVVTVGGFFLWRKWRSGDVDRLKDALIESEARRDVARLEGEREAKLEQEADLAEKDARLQARDADLGVAIDTAKRRAVEARERVEGRTDAEVAERFNQLYRRDRRR